MRTMMRWMAVAALAVGVALGVGCAGAPKTIAYKTLRAAGEGVDVAMKAYADAVVAGAVDETKQAQVRVLYNQYREAFAQALMAARFNYSTAPPADVAALAAQLTALLVSYAHGVDRAYRAPREPSWEALAQPPPPRDAPVFVPPADVGEPRLHALPVPNDPSLPPTHTPTPR